MFNFFLAIRRMFTKKPDRKLTWCVDDYEIGKKWAKSVPHPFMKNKTLWDLCYDRVDSTNTLHNINKFLFNEI